MILSLLEKFDTVLGVLAYQPRSKISKAEIKESISERKKARDVKDFAKADRIRAELLAKGIEIKDTPEGTTWKIKWSGMNYPKKRLASPRSLA